MYGYIYETTNLINGKKYIGKHKSNKFDYNYYGSGIGLKRALNKYGKANFKVEILEEVYTNQKDLDELETYYIKKFNAVKNKNYYNNSYGGESEGWQGVIKAKRELNSCTISKETRIKISNTLKNHEVTKSTRAKISKSQKNKKLSINHREKISKSLKGRTSPMKNRNQSKESRIKISKGMIGINKGRKMSEEFKHNMSLSKKGRIWINNGIKTKQIRIDDFELYQNLGYTKGRILHTIKIGGAINESC